jgi:hypothetical protein
MNQHFTLVIVAVVLSGAAVFLYAEEETRESDIATFESVQQDKDYRVSLLGVTKGIAFLDSQYLIDDGGRPPGTNAVPWVRVVTVIENLSDKDEPMSFTAETAEGNELVGKLKIERSGNVVTSRVSGVTEIDCDSPSLREAIFPAGMPEGLDVTKSKIYSFTMSGKFQPSDTMVLRLSFGDADNRRELVFTGVPLP